MPRVPKPANQLQQAPHRNTVSTASVLDSQKRVRTPKLPDRPGHLWNPLTLVWWRDIWRSPMAPEFLKSDYHGLYIVADLVDQFWTNPDVKIASEIRQQRQCFGLTPLDRRRLQWTVQRVEEGAAKKAPKREDPVRDTRELLRVLG